MFRALHAGQPSMQIGLAMAGIQVPPLAFLGVVMWTTAQSALTAYRYGRVSSVMLYALWLPMVLIPAGLGLMGVTMLAALMRQVRALGRRNADEVPPAEGSGG